MMHLFDTGRQPRVCRPWRVGGRDVPVTCRWLLGASGAWAPPGDGAPLAVGRHGSGGDGVSRDAVRAAGEERYEPTERDRHDMAVLRRVFGIATHF
jgi:hypothetical protein